MNLCHTQRFRNFIQIIIIEKNCGLGSFWNIKLAIQIHTINSIEARAIQINETRRLHLSRSRARIPNVVVIGSAMVHFVGQKSILNGRIVPQTGICGYEFRI